MASACGRLTLRNALNGTSSGSEAAEWVAAPGAAQRVWPGGAWGGRQGSGVPRHPALAAHGIKLGVDNGEEAALVQRSERRVRGRLSTERLEEAVEPAGDGPVREAVGRLHVEDVPQGPHLRGPRPLAAFRRHLVTFA